MKFKRLILTTLVVAVATIVAAFGIFLPAQPVQVGAAPPTPTPSPYPMRVLSSAIDGSDADDDCTDRPTFAVGCESIWGDHALDGNHVFYRPAMITPTGKLLVFLCGGKGSAEPCEPVFGVAAGLGYHVMAVSYAAELDVCGDLEDDDKLACFGDVMVETVSGGEDVSALSHMSEHAQDAIANRMTSALEWIIANQNDGDGWDAYLTDEGDIDWSKAHLAGFSNGSSHVSFMGTQPEFHNVGRVALFAGPNDGKGGSPEGWDSATYIQEVDGITDTRYYGLVHFLNNGKNYTDDVRYKVTKNWELFGMAGQHEFDPDPDIDEIDFQNAHMLINIDPPPPSPAPTPVSTDLGTTFEEAHLGTVKNRYCSQFELDEESVPEGDWKCVDFEGSEIGLEPAWRCILGSGDWYESERPVSNAGPSQTVECQSDGGATVDLDGSGSTDADCDILKYAWAGPFGLETGRNPNVFCPVGFNFIALVASDDWWASLLPSTTLVNVVDTTPPSLTVTLSSTTLRPADHRLVRIDATMTSSDSCGAAPVQVVLTSITNSQADNGLGDGDTDRDIQEASYETLDTSFYLRAERAGNVTAGRTYTVKYTATDASGNQTEVSTTVYVPHSQ